MNDQQRASIKIENGYWCVICGRFLEAQDGVITHDNVPHPDNMTFDDEDKPQ
jgi:hypothetical protein